MLSSYFINLNGELARTILILTFYVNFKDRNLFYNAMNLVYEFFLSISFQPAYVVHIFPPCDFSRSTLERLGFGLMQPLRDLAHLLVIITTVA